MKYFLLMLLLVLSKSVIAQIKIGDNPQILDGTSLLELESTSKVLVISRMSENDMLALSPLQGALVYNIDASCIFYYDGVAWNNLCSSGSSGSINWGSITGTLSDQADLASEFQNYVDFISAQSIGGEKTLTEKFTVNTGDNDAQIAEFFGRVKGEDAIAPEDFVTKAQLDALEGSSNWGSITGTLVNQADLASKFQNYVDLISAQSIGGEKTLTEKFTVNTGDNDAQIAEFLGRVKGEDGTAPEDFVTKLQLDAIAAGGHTGTEGSIFFAGSNAQPIEDNDNLFYDENNKQFRVGAFNDLIDKYTLYYDDSTTLSIKGSVSKPVHQATTLTEEHYTTIISWSTYVTLPDAAQCFGRIYVVKIRPDVRVQIRGYTGYIDSASVRRLEFPSGKVTQLQSNGLGWEQIN